MARKKKGHKMNPVRKWLRVGVSSAFKVTGALVAASPLFRGLKIMLTGDVENGAAGIVFDTTGYSTGGQVDPGQVVKTGIVVIAGLGIAWLGGQVARRL